MKKIIIILLVLFSVSNVFAQVPDGVYNKKYGGSDTKTVRQNWPQGAYVRCWCENL